MFPPTHFKRRYVCQQVLLFVRGGGIVPFGGRIWEQYGLALLRLGALFLCPLETFLLLRPSSRGGITHSPNQSKGATAFSGVKTKPLLCLVQCVELPAMTGAVTRNFQGSLLVESFSLSMAVPLWLLVGGYANP